MTEHHVSNLLVRINDTKILGDITHIRLLQLKEKEWLKDNPLETWPYNNPVNFKNNLIAQILCLMNNLNMGFNQNQEKIKPDNRIQLGSIIPNFRKCITLLKNKNLKYLDQITANYDRLLTKDQAFNILNASNKGKTPNWWTKLEDEVLESHEKRILKKDYRNITLKTGLTYNTCLLMNYKLDKREKRWIVSQRYGSRNRTSFIFEILSNNSWNNNQSNINIIHYKRTGNQFSIIKLKKCNQSNCNRKTS